MAVQGQEAGAGLSASSAIAGSLRNFAGRAQTLRKSWFTELVASYLRWRTARKPPLEAADEETESERAERIVREACVKASLSGAAAGTLATGAALLTGETGGSGAVFAIPAGLLAIGGDMVLRALVHLDMTCDLAEVFGVPFEPEHPDELWRLYSLAFHTVGGGSDEDRDVLHRIIDPEDMRIGAEIGNKLVGESVLRNAVPFLGVLTSAAASWRLTREVGDTVRRACRYRRAFLDILAEHPRLRGRYMPLVVEGLWFVFTADGHLSPEEAATLAGALHRAPAGRVEELENRLVDDESRWLARLSTLPEADRGPYLELLEVAAAVDKAYSEPERQMVGKAAKALHVTRRKPRVPKLIEQFREVGVLDM